MVQVATPAGVGIASLVWFLEDRKTTPATKPSPLPSAQERVGSSIERPYVSMETREIEDLLFTRHPLMFDEYGPGVQVLRLRLDAIEDLKDLEHLLGILHKELRFIDDPESSIRQTNAMWNGVGAREFLKCAADIKLRYADVKTNIHHSEELWIFAEIPDGLMLLSIRQRFSPPYRLDSGELVIRAATLPLNLGAYQRVARAVGDPQRRNSCPRRRRESTQTGRAAHLERSEITGFSSRRVCRKVCHTGCAYMRL